jgi:hypothetical protein
MSPQTLASPWSPHGTLLSLPAQLAVERYLDAMRQIAPDLAAQAVVGPGNEGTVYVYVPLPVDEDQNIALHEAVAEIGADLVAETGIVMVLMPAISEPAAEPSAEQRAPTPPPT